MGGSGVDIEFANLMAMAAGPFPDVVEEQPGEAPNGNSITPVPSGVLAGAVRTDSASISSINGTVAANRVAANAAHTDGASVGTTDGTVAVNIAAADAARTDAASIGSTDGIVAVN